MTHMLCEILAQALGQINSVATRLRLGFPASPRQLRTLILTLPSAMPKQEREIFRQRMFEALALVWKPWAGIRRMRISPRLSSVKKRGAST